MLLTALWFGCPLVELELGEQGAVLVVLLHIQGHIITTLLQTCKLYSSEDGEKIQNHYLKK